MKETRIIIALIIILMSLSLIFFVNSKFIALFVIMIVFICLFLILNEFIKLKDEFLFFLEKSGTTWIENGGKKIHNFSLDVEKKQDFKELVLSEKENIRFDNIEYKKVIGRKNTYLTQEQIIITNSLIKKTNYVGYLKADDINDATELLDNEQEFNIYREIDKQVNKYFSDFDILFLKLSDDKWVFFPQTQQYNEMIKSEFEIIKNMQTSTAELGAEISITIGIAGSHKETLKDLDELAESTLRVANLRGGGQAVVDINGKQEFYGSKLRIFEKRSKVRVRAFANALTKEINLASNIMIMGHRNMDMDCFASCFSIYYICNAFKKDARIIFNFEDSTYDVKRAYQSLITDNPELKEIFITNNIGNYLSENGLLIIADVTSQELVEKPEIVEFFDRRILIDHHIINDKVLQGSTITYVETYASSTSEIITEIYDYIDGVELNRTASTLLLAGILVDTKLFMYNTGTRTFEASARLRTKGATTENAQKFLQDDIETAKKFHQLISSSKKIQEGFYYVVVDEQVTKTDLAKIADYLINFENSNASFAIGKIKHDEVYISARSSDDVSVHRIMEGFGGGGHANAAAAAITGKTISDVEQLLINTVKELSCK